MAVQDWTEPNVCVDENIDVDASGLLVIQPFAVPQLAMDVKVKSGGDGPLLELSVLPGKLLMETQFAWRNNGPLPCDMMVRCIRGPKSWISSNPNAIQFRDRYTYTIDPEGVTPSIPVTTSIYNSQTGTAIDLGTNSVAEPLPGLDYVWIEASCTDEWIGPANPGEKVEVWFRGYVWTPPPFSDNGNKNAPIHNAVANWTRLQLWAYPTQGTLVTG